MSLRLTCLCLMLVWLLAGCANISEQTTVPAPTAEVPTPVANVTAASTATAIPTSADNTGAAIATATAVPAITGENEPEAPAAAAVTADLEWATRAPLPEPNSETAVAQLDDQIYVIGGYPSSRTSVSTVHVYHAATDSWSLAAPLPGPVNHAMAAAVNGKVYVIGGQSGAGGGGLNAAAVNGCLHVLGGEGSEGVFPQHEVYDPTTDTWHSLPPMPTPVHGVTGAAVIDGWIYLPGGGTAVGGSSGSTIHQVVQATMQCG